MGTKDIYEYLHTHPDICTNIHMLTDGGILKLLFYLIKKLHFLNLFRTQPARRYWGANNQTTSKATCSSSNTPNSFIKL